MTMMALLILGGITRPASGQDDQRRDADVIRVPQGQSEIQFDSVERIPRQLLRAIRRNECGFETWLPHIPVRIIKPAPDVPWIATVPCGSIVASGKAFQFDTAWWKEPRQLSFPVVAFPAGFGVTSLPGFLVWNAEDKTLTATQGTDVCPGREVRYTYQYGPQAYKAGLAPTLVKAEHRPKNCPADAAWSVYWEATPWPDQLVPR